MDPVNEIAVNNWFDNPGAVVPVRLAEHVKQAHKYLKNHTGWGVSSDLLNKVRFACTIWNGSEDPQVRQRCVKIRQAAAKFALPHVTLLKLLDGDFPLNQVQLDVLIDASQMLKGMMVSGRAEVSTGIIDFSEKGISSKTFEALFALIQNGDSPITTEEIFEIFDAADFLRMEKLLQVIFKELNRVIPQLSLEQACAVYNKYNTKQYEAIQELVLIHISVCLVPTGPESLYELVKTPEMERCQLGKVSLVDHFLFSAVAILPRLLYQKDNNLPFEEPVYFYQHSSALPSSVAQFMRHRFHFRRREYVDSWNYFIQVVQRYPHSETVLERFGALCYRLITTNPPVDVYSSLQQLISKNPDNKDLRITKRMIFLELWNLFENNCDFSKFDFNKFDFEKLYSFIADLEFILLKEGANPLNVSKVMTTIVHTLRFKPELRFQMELMQKFEMYLFKFLEITNYNEKGLAALITFFAVLKTSTGISVRVIEITKVLIQRFPAHEDTVMLSELLSRNFPDVYAKIFSQV